MKNGRACLLQPATDEKWPCLPACLLQPACYSLLLMKNDRACLPACCLLLPAAAARYCLQAVMSRDLWRLCTRLDLFRLLHFYHSATGFFININLLMATIYASIYALL